MDDVFPADPIISDLRDANTNERMADRPPVDDNDPAPTTLALDDVAPVPSEITGIDDV